MKIQPSLGVLFKVTLLVNTISATTSTFYAVNEDGSCNSPADLTTSDNAYSVVSSRTILPNNLDCTLSFVGPKNSQFLVNFQQISLEFNSNSTVDPCRDYVQLSVQNDTASEPGATWEITTHTDQNEYVFINTTSGSGELCGYTEFERNLPSPMVTSTNVVSVKITTDSSSQSHGFQFIITPINSNTLTPNPSTVRCNGMVISSDLVCDGEQNCYDGTDEPRDKNVDIRGLCPEPPFKTPIGEIVLWVLLSLAGLLLLSVIFYFVKRKVDEVYLRGQLKRMEAKIMEDEGIKVEGDADELKQDIFDMM